VTPVDAVTGVATFSGMSIDKAGTGYTLSAASSGLTGATSSAFNITPASVSASQSTVTASSPITASSGSSQSTITVTAKDANGNVISGLGVLLATTGSNNALNQPVGTTDGTGVATGTLSSTTAESKTVSATINGVAINQTATVVVNASAATQLVFTVQPTDTTALSTIAPPVRVAAEDQFGNVDSTFTGPVLLTLIGGTTGAVLGSARNPQAAAAGTATYSDLSVDLAGTGYQLQASALGLSTGTSNTFNIH